MKRILIAGLAIVAIAGCNKQQPAAPAAPAATETPAVTTAPPEAAKPIQFETTPLEVAATAITEQDPAILKGAEWTTKQCALTAAEGVNEITAAAGAPTHMAGFFIDATDKPAGQFDIILKGEGKNYQIPAKTGWDRSDVAEFFKMPDLASAGFDANVTLSPTVPKGKYKVDFMLDRAGKKFFCESGKTLIVN